MNIIQRVLSHLNTLTEPTRKSTIAKALGASENYVAKALAELNRAHYTRESKGFYQLTQRGRRAISDDPLLLDFFTDKAKVRKISFEPPFRKVSRSKACQQVIENKAAIREMGNLADDFLPMVLMWCIMTDVKIPEFTFDVINDPADELREEIFNQFLAGLIKIQTA